MAKSAKSTSAKKRVKVQNLPTAEKELTKQEAKKVKGGMNVSLNASASVRGTNLCANEHVSEEFFKRL